MHEYEVLEKRWKRRKFKKRLKIALPLLAATIGAFLLLKRDTTNPPLPPASFQESRNDNIITPSMSFEKRLHRYVHQNESLPKPHKKKSTTPRSAQVQPAHSTSILITSEVQSLDQLLQKYRNQPSLELAMLIAKRFYRKGAYKKAMEWCMRANEYDNKNEESWILFAKSAFKAGEKQKALKALTLYIRRTGSARAKDVLEEMRMGDVR